MLRSVLSLFMSPHLVPICSGLTVATPQMSVAKTQDAGRAVAPQLFTIPPLWQSDCGYLPNRCTAR